MYRLRKYILSSKNGIISMEGKAGVVETQDLTTVTVTQYFQVHNVDSVVMLMLLIVMWMPVLQMKIILMWMITFRCCSMMLSNVCPAIFATKHKTRYS